MKWLTDLKKIRDLKNIRCEMLFHLVEGPLSPDELEARVRRKIALAYVLDKQRPCEPDIPLTLTSEQLVDLLVGYNFREVERIVDQVRLGLDLSVSVEGGKLRINEIGFGEIIPSLTPNTMDLAEVAA